MRQAICALMCFAWAAPSSAQLPDDVAEAAKSLTVVVRGTLGDADTLGGGIIVGVGQDQLFIATANHVVRRGTEQAKDLRVSFFWLPGSFPAELLEDVDQGLDLTVMRVRGLSQLALTADLPPFARLGDAAATARGAAVFSVGHPRGTLWRLAVKPEHVAQPASDIIRFESTAVYEGHSGGALLDGDGRLIGMIRTDAPPDVEAVRIDRVIERLREWRYPVALRPSEAVRSTTAPPSGPPASYIPQLNATVKSWRFFDALADGLPSPAHRSYSTRFAVRGIPRIAWELNLVYPQRTGRLDFRIATMWYAPNGAEEARSVIDAYLDAGSSDSRHFDSWGMDEGGFFVLGTHRVELSINGQLVASEAFEVFDGDAQPTLYVQALEARVDSLLFFESSPFLPNERSYGERFRRSFTRSVYWELNLTYPRLNSPTNFAIRDVWTGPDGRIAFEGRRYAFAGADWFSSRYNFDYPSNERGALEVGTYRVDLYVQNRRVASGLITIDP